MHVRFTVLMLKRALLPIGLEGREFLLEAQYIREILGKVDFVRVPLADRQVPGVFLWNGQALPLLDLNYCLGLGGKSDGARTVVSKVGPHFFGFFVDRLNEVVELAVDDFVPVRVFETPFAEAEMEFRDKVATLLNLPELIARAMHADVTNSASL